MATDKALDTLNRAMMCHCCSPLVRSVQRRLDDRHQRKQINKRRPTAVPLTNQAFVADNDDDDDDDAGQQSRLTLVRDDVDRLRRQQVAEWLYRQPAAAGDSDSSIETLLFHEMGFALGNDITDQTMDQIWRLGTIVPRVSERLFWHYVAQKGLAVASNTASSKSSFVLKTKSPGLRSLETQLLLAVCNAVPLQAVAEPDQTNDALQRLDDHYRDICCQWQTAGATIVLFEADQRQKKKTQLRRRIKKPRRPKVVAKTRKPSTITITSSSISSNRSRTTVSRNSQEESAPVAAIRRHQTVPEVSRADVELALASRRLTQPNLAVVSSSSSSRAQPKTLTKANEHNRTRSLPGRDSDNKSEPVVRRRATAMADVDHQRQPTSAKSTRSTSSPASSVGSHGQSQTTGTTTLIGSDFFDDDNETQPVKESKMGGFRHVDSFETNKRRQAGKPRRHSGVAGPPTQQRQDSPRPRRATIGGVVVVGSASSATSNTSSKRSSPSSRSSTGKSPSSVAASNKSIKASKSSGVDRHRRRRHTNCDGGLAGGRQSEVKPPRQASLPRLSWAVPARGDADQSRNATTDDTY